MHTFPNINIKRCTYTTVKREHFEIVFNNAADILTSGP